MPTGSNEKPNDSVIFSLSDIGMLLRRNKFRIQLATVVCALCTLCYTVQRPVLYEVKATFKEKSGSGPNFGGGLSGMLGLASGGSQEHEASTLMKSRKLMTDVVRKLDLQGVVRAQGSSRGLIGTIRDNVTVQIAHFNHSAAPVLPNHNPPLKCTEISYPGELPISIAVKFLGRTQYTASIGGVGEIGRGELGEPFSYENTTFTLAANGEMPSKGTQYTVTLLPMASISESYASAVEIEPDKDSASLLKLQYRHRDRHFAATFLNEVMANYQRFLHDQNDRKAEMQLAYLDRRLEETDQGLRKILNSHAEDLASDVSKSGIMDFGKETDALSRTQQGHRSRLMAIELDLRRVAHAKEQGGTYYDRLSLEGGQTAISEATRIIRDLRQKGDNLKLALEELKPLRTEDFAAKFQGQISQLEEIHRFKNETMQLLAGLDGNQPNPLELSITKDPNYLIGLWLQQEDDSSDIKRKHFAAYLKNLIKTFTVHTEIIEQRLAHHQNPSTDFQGLDIETAEQMYVVYQRDLNDVQTSIRQQQHILQKMGDPGFDITALSIALSDSVSVDMIKLAADLIMRLRDEENRSEKEQNRIRNQLTLQREVLSSHLAQQTRLLELKEELLSEKIRALMATTLDLVHQHISVLEKHINDAVENRGEALNEEKFLLNEDLDQLRQQLASLPQRWVSEQLINLHLNLSQRTVEEITKLVESKNISHSLEIIESAPIDPAIAPILPRSPQIPLFSLVGAFLGLTFSSAFIMLRAISRGVPVSKENLFLLGQNVSGTVSRRSEMTPTQTLSNSDLETMRRVKEFIASSLPDGGSVHLSIGKGPNYALHLATLLGHTGKRSLILYTSFQRPANPNELPGVLQVLEGKAEAPKIQTSEEYGLIAAGGITRYSSELLGSSRFDQLLQELKDDHSYVLIVNESPPCSAEATGLNRIADLAIVTLSTEKLPEVSPLTQKSNQKISFLIQEDRIASPLPL